MFDKKYEDRMRAWIAFRSSLEHSETPLNDVIKLYNLAPLVNRQVDPYDQSVWPDPWLMLKENSYCDFAIILGICYTLQLTDRFSHDKFEIHICTDRLNSEAKYLLYINDESVIGFDRYLPVAAATIPVSLVAETRFVMPNLQ